MTAVAHAVIALKSDRPAKRIGNMMSWGSAAVGFLQYREKSPMFKPVMSKGSEAYRPTY